MQRNGETRSLCVVGYATLEGDSSDMSAESEVARFGGLLVSPTSCFFLEACSLVRRGINGSTEDGKYLLHPSLSDEDDEEVVRSMISGLEDIGEDAQLSVIEEIRVYCDLGVICDELRVNWG